MSHDPPKRKGGPPSAAQLELDNFWPKALEDVRNLTPNDFKAQADLPLARIKKIMKLDDDVKMISAEAPVVFAKAAEIFIHELTLRAWIQAEEGKRRTLQRSDIAQAIAKCDQFDFLIDIVPREEVKPPKPTASESKPNVVQEQLVYNVQVGADGTLLTPQMQAHPQLMQLQGLSGLSAQVGQQQQALQTVQVLGANGQLQTVALVGGGGLSLQGVDQNGEVQLQQAQRQVQIPAGFQIINQGGGPQIVQLQQPTAGQRSQSTSNAQGNAPAQAAANQNIQILQQIVGPNGEIQHIPISLTAAQLQSFRSQAQAGGVCANATNLLAQGGHQVVHVQQVPSNSGVAANPLFMSQGQTSSS